MKHILTAAMLSMAMILPGIEAHAYEVINVTNGGTITGKVSFMGNDPTPQPFTISKDPGTCGKGKRLIDFVKVNNGALTEAVVYLKKIERGKAFSADLKPPVINQKGCEFNPYMSITRDGETLTVLNSDGVLHNVHLFELIGSAKRTLFNMNHPANLREVSTPVNLNKGSAVKLECDAHDFMHGFMFVAKNPYYALVNQDGTFQIDNIPPGDYKVRAWHPTLGMKRGKATVSAGATVTVDFTFKALY